MPIFETTDFRDVANAASEKLKRNGRFRSLPESEVSLCLRRDDDGLMGSYSLRALLLILFGGVMAIGSVPLFFVHWGWGAAALVIGTLPIVLLGTLLQARNRRVLRYECAEMQAMTGEEPDQVSLENPETFTKMKFIGDDTGLIAFLPDLARIWIEGIRFRYLIRSEDVTSIDALEFATVKAIRIEYRVGEVALAVAISSTAMGERFDERVMECLEPFDEAVSNDEQDEPWQDEANVY